MRISILSMRIVKNEEKVNKLCENFSSLDESDQEHIFDILKALLFAKLKSDTVIVKQGTRARKK